MDDDETNPQHYKNHPSGVECIEITEHFNFCIGNAIEYLWRAGEKPGESALDDLQKAAWYVEREIGRLKKPVSEAEKYDINEFIERTIAKSKSGSEKETEWRGVGGATAWHLIARHAENWADVGKMMEAWLTANGGERPLVKKDTHE